MGVQEDDEGNVGEEDLVFFFSSSSYLLCLSPLLLLPRDQVQTALGEVGRGADGRDLERWGEEGEAKGGRRHGWGMELLVRKKKESGLPW